MSETSAVGDLADFERRVIDRAARQEARLISKLRAATSGQPVGQEPRPAAETDGLLRANDPILYQRVSAMAPFLGPSERRAINTRFEKAGLPLPFAPEDTEEEDELAR